MYIIEEKTKNSRYWRDAWAFREIVLFLVWRNLLVRYKQTAVGVAWTFLRPLIMVTVLTIVFGKLANLAAFSTVPYPLLVLTGLLPWYFFSSTITECSESIVMNATLVSKIYFPRILIPLSYSITVLADFAVTLLFLAAAFWWYQYPLSGNILFLPLGIFLCWSLSLGIGLWMAAYNVRYRDFRHVIPFLIQCGLYITPVGFSSQLVSENWSLFFALNPLVGIIDLFRWCLLGPSQPLNAISLSFSIIVSLLAFVSGIRYFRHAERTFADII